MPNTIHIDSAVIINDKGASYDMTNTVLALVMYESIFNNTMTGNVVVVDTENIQETLPIVGTEVFYVSYKTDLGILDLVFDVVSINDIKSNNQETKTFELQLASRQTLINSNIKLKSRFVGTTSSVVEDLMLNYLGLPESFTWAEPTTDTVNCVPPSISPLAFINWLCENIGYNADSRSAFYYYETTKGTYLQSLELMKELPVVTTLSFSEAEESSVRSNIRILNYTLKQRFDTITNLAEGSFSGTVYTHDLLTKRLTKTEQWNPNTGLLSFRDAYSADSNISLLNNVDPLSILQRGFVRGEFNHNNLIIEIHGNGLLAVGDKVKIDIPSTRKTDAKAGDVMLSGEYIITKIKHHLTTAAYKMIVELNKYDKETA